MQEVDSLKAEMSKSKMGISAVSGQAGRIPQIPGVLEIEYSELEIGAQIGQGGFSIIKTGSWRGTSVAIKIIFDPMMTDELIDEITNEIRMVSLLRHPNIVTLMGVSTIPPNIAIAFENLEAGSLYDYLHTPPYKEISMNDRLKIARQVACAFEFMHTSGIVHRDLKSHNVLLTPSLDVKICDFGLARFMADLNRGAMQFSGTPAYMAAELYEKKTYNEKVDVFAFGTLLWELVAK